MGHGHVWRGGRHVVFSLHVHLVFVTKYRRGAIAPDLHERLRGWFESVCSDFEAELLEYGGEDDHVHLLVAYPPKVSVSRLVNSLKGVSARRIRALNRADVRDKLWGRAFWSPSYCAVSTGGAALDTVRRYIERQRAGSPREA
jgi:putative transposase